MGVCWQKDTSCERKGLSPGTANENVRDSATNNKKGIHLGQRTECGVFQRGRTKRVIRWRVENTTGLKNVGIWRGRRTSAKAWPTFAKGSTFQCRERDVVGGYRRGKIPSRKGTLENRKKVFEKKKKRGRLVIFQEGAARSKEEVG